MTTTTEQLIPTDKIDAPEWNSRTSIDEDRLKSLADSLKRDGQRQAIEVETIPGTDRFLLVFGSRRLAATRLAQLPDIRANVKPPTSSAARMLANAIENLQREDLTTFELARTCSALRQQKLSLSQCAAATGMSESYVSNLVKCYEGLHPDILAEWQESVETYESKGEDAPKSPCTVSYFRNILIKFKKDEQPAVWAAHKAAFKEAATALDDTEEDPTPCEDCNHMHVEGEACDAEGCECGHREPSPSQSYSVKKAHYNALVKALKAAKSPALTLHVAEFLVGKRKEIKGLIKVEEKGE
jgi:ParB/RepB/Spo0J family partition protein